jgi:hypothetical protein
LCCDISMPERALYYPEWGIADPAVLFEALLYWDRLACIVPYDGFQPVGSVDPEFYGESQELHERFVTGLSPSLEQKQAVHERIVAYIEEPPPEWYRPENLTPEQQANISALKIAPQTEKLLRDRGWVRLTPKGPERLYDISLAAADLILAALVDEFASETLPPLTGDQAAYSATCNALLQQLRASKGIVPDDDTERVAVGQGAVDAFMATSFLRLGVSERPVTPNMLRRLRKLRDDPDFEGQRSQFCRKVDEYIANVRAAPDVERPLVYDDWKRRLAQDREALRRDLRRAGFETVIEKESVVSLFVTGGMSSVAAASLGPVGLAIGLGLGGARLAVAWRKRRRQVAEQHWTSFLFSVSRPRLGLQR